MATRASIATLSRRSGLRVARPLARRLLRRRCARCGDGRALCALRARRRPCLRHRRPCRRPHRQLPPARRACRRARAAAAVRTCHPRHLCRRRRGDAGRGGVRGAGGAVTLRINSANPTVSTASADFVAAADGAGGWEGQAWDKAVEVPCTTLDALIADTAGRVRQDRRGRLRGSRAGRPVPAAAGALLRIHHHPARCGASPASIGWPPSGPLLSMSRSARASSDLRPLGLQSRHGRPLASLPHAANSGDVYCVLQS